MTPGKLTYTYREDNGELMEITMDPTGIEVGVDSSCEEEYYYDMRLTMPTASGVFFKAVGERYTLRRTGDFEVKRTFPVRVTFLGIKKFAKESNAPVYAEVSINNKEVTLSWQTTA